MSVDISVSNTKSPGCNDIINKLLKANINVRTIETISIADGNIEKGCLITLGKDYFEKNNLSKFWKLLENDYTCSHVNINGIYNGCIYNYLADDKCPGNNV